MATRFVTAILAGLTLIGGSLLAGCSSDAGQRPDAGGMQGTGGQGGQGIDGSQEADFMPCKDTPAVPYTPGMLVTSMSGGYVVTLKSAKTDFSDGTPSASFVAVGLDTWVVSVTDAAAGTPGDVTMTAERPIMPFHGHGATTYPQVVEGDPGQFTMTGIDFFMPGYWQQKLNLQPTSGALDHATFEICVP